MKKLALLLIVTILSLSLAGCGDPMVIEGKDIPTYGFINENSAKYEDVEYQISIGNVIWAIILCETIVAPIYFIGFSLYEPVGRDTGKRNKL